MSDRPKRPGAEDSDSALEVELRDCLAHFHDYAYLVAHPFLSRYAGLFGDDEAAAVHTFRRSMTRFIERLRPEKQIPQDDPAWRPYLVLYNRYLLGRDLGAAQLELQLSKRQIQREQRRGIEALLAALAQSGDQAQPASAASPGPNDAIRSHVLPERGSFGEVEVADQIERALASVGPLAVSQKVLLRFLPPSSDLVIEGYPALFRQLLVSLLSLAIRQAEGATVNVQVDSSDPGHCTVTLGIAFSSRATPEPLTLGPVQEAMAQVQQANLAVRETACGSSIEARWACRPPQETVVLVEDNRDLISLMTVYLQEQGYTVIPVSDSRAAVEEIRERLPDYIVLDVVLQGIDGWEILRQLKADERTERIPVVICSVLQEPELANALGADAYLPKPVTPADLRQCLDRLAEQRKGLLATPR